MNLFIDSLEKHYKRLGLMLKEIPPENAPLNIKMLGESLINHNKVILDEIEESKIFRFEAKKAELFYGMRVEYDSLAFPSFDTMFIDLDIPIKIEILYEGIKKDDWIQGILISTMRSVGYHMTFFYTDFEYTNFLYDPGMLLGERDSILIRHCEDSINCKCRDAYITREIKKYSGKLQDNSCYIFDVLPDEEGKYDHICNEDIIRLEQCPHYESMYKLWTLQQHILNYIESKQVERKLIDYIPSSIKTIGEYTQPIPRPYYVLELKENCVIGGGKPHRGGKHRYKYDVRGHFRRTEKGLIWVSEHYRGVKNIRYIPKIYTKTKGFWNYAVKSFTENSLVKLMLAKGQNIIITIKKAFDW